MLRLKPLTKNEKIVLKFIRERWLKMGVDSSREDWTPLYDPEILPELISIQKSEAEKDLRAKGLILDVDTSLYPTPLVDAYEEQGLLDD